MKTLDFDYELIDCGDGGRIERFGNLVIDRPCPQALWNQKIESINPDVFFERDHSGSSWKNAEKFPETWPLKVGNITAELRFSGQGQVGIFPEQIQNWSYIVDKLCKEKSPPLKILNGFAYTGIATLCASYPHTEVCHVDGAKSVINWGKKNAEISGLSDNKIRWICDDVSEFMDRESRREKKYDAIILDPPAFGRAGKKTWKIERDLPSLVNMIPELLTEKPQFVILTCHAPDHFSPQDLANMLDSIPQFKEKRAERLFLEIPSKSGNSLPSSFGARISL